MKGFVSGFLLAALLATAGYWVIIRRPEAATTPAGQTTQKYYCPMHPSFVSDSPGDCPICNMRLVPMEEKAGDAPSTEESMDHSDHQHMDHTDPAERPASPSVPGYLPVTITAERQQLMGVKLEEARVMDLEETLTTVGRVAIDETRLHHIHTKFEGYIEEIFVTYVGQYVKRGNPLFSVYAPELLATQEEYLLALKAQEKNPELDIGVNLLEAARRRLALWDMTEAEIAQLARTRQPKKAITVRSHVNGYVTALMAAHGTRVSPADELYTIVDFSSVWVLADIYEVNLPMVRVGQTAEMTLISMPGKVWKGKVTYIYPTLDETTRTAKARIQFANPGGHLKPEMIADIVLKGRAGRGVVVPESAVLSTGERHVVFVATGNGVFQPREVVPGVKVRNFYEIKSGVAAGEKVAIGANFLIDSESKLRAAVSGPMGGHQH